MATKEEKLLSEVLNRLKRIERKLLPTAEAIEFYALINGQRIRVVSMFLAADKKLPLSLEILDAQQNPAKVDGLPAWALADESLASLEVSEDGMSAVLTPKGGVGAFKVQVKCDADLGEGVEEIIGELDVEIVSTKAVFVGIKAGEPQDIPVPA